MRLIVGLGNPGGKYTYTRHNIGFWVVDSFFGRRGARAAKKMNDALGVSLDVGGAECWFIKPQTFMNLSGKSVAAIARKLKVSPGETLVLHDEADFDVGRLQLKLGGGSSGHNGLESIFAEWGERNFWRLRIGVGKAPDRDLADYVLEKVDETMLRPLAEKGADALEKILSLSPEKAINEINRAQGT